MFLIMDKEKKNFWTGVKWSTLVQDAYQFDTEDEVRLEIKRRDSVTINGDLVLMYRLPKTAQIVQVENAETTDKVKQESMVEAISQSIQFLQHIECGKTCPLSQRDFCASYCVRDELIHKLQEVLQSFRGISDEA